MATRRVRILAAVPGRMVGRKFKPFKGRARRQNIAQGFYDTRGQFHPIRSSPDYDPSRESRAPRKKAKKAKPRRAVKRATKKKAKKSKSKRKR